MKIGNRMGGVLIVIGTLGACIGEGSDDGDTAGDDVAAVVGCDGVVPSGALVLRAGEEQEIVDAGKSVLVCAGAVLIAHGGNTDVWVMSGGEVNVNGGSSDVVSEGMTVINVNADNVRVFDDGASTVTDNGQNTDVTMCSAVTIDTGATAGC